VRTDAEALDFALGLWSEEPGQRVWLGGAAQDIMVRLSQAPLEDLPRAVELTRHFYAITQDIWNVSTIIDRLEWMRATSLGDSDLAERWTDYAAVDIQSFHVEVRSALDQAAHVVRLFAPNPGQVTDTGSFRKLLEWIPDNGIKLQAPVGALTLDQATWFHEMRSVRDHLIHKGGLTIVFGHRKDGILFQVVDEQFRRLVNKPFLMFNDNVVWFNRYAALYLARMLGYIEELAGLYLDTFRSKYTLRGAKSGSNGFRTLVRWMRDLRAQLV
jgi:hypothetical protein